MVLALETGKQNSGFRLFPKGVQRSFKPVDDFRYCIYRIKTRTEKQIADRRTEGGRVAVLQLSLAKLGPELFNKDA